MITIPSTSYTSRRRSYNYLGNPPLGAWVTSSLTALSQDEQSVPRTVLHSEELDVGSFRRQQLLLPTTRYAVTSERAVVRHGAISGNRRLQTSDPSCAKFYTEYESAAGLAFTTVNVASGMPTPPVVDYAALRQEAHAQANSSAVDLLTNAAELGESVQMFRTFLDVIKNRGQLVRDIVYGLRGQHSIERRVYSAAQAADVFNSVWMTYRYGWRPFVSEANKLIDNIKKIQERGQKKLLIARGQATRQLNSSATGKSGLTVSVVVPTVTTITATRDVSVTGRSWVRHKILPIFGDWSFNPLVSAWELVPASFVVDWFFNVGQVIQANFGGMGVHQTVTGSSRKTDVSLSATAIGNPALCSINYGTATAEYASQTYERWPDSVLPPPPVWISGSDKLSIAQCIDITIIAKNFLGLTFEAIAATAIQRRRDRST